MALIEGSLGSQWPGRERYVFSGVDICKSPVLLSNSLSKLLKANLIKLTGPTKDKIEGPSLDKKGDECK